MVNAAAALQVTATAVLAGIPVQVLAVAVVDIATDAMVQTPAAVVATPVVPNLNVPSTSSRAHGVLVPIPTEPLLAIRMTSTGATLVVPLRLANTISP